MTWPQIDDLRVHVCELCGGDGGWDHVVGHDPDGPVWRWAPCVCADGLYEAEYEPITLRDLDDATGTEARSGETACGLDPKGDGPVPEGQSPR